VLEAEPNVLAAPNAGVVVAVLLVEITEGANGFGGLLAPNVNGVLFEAVVVVVADGKLKPDEDVDVVEELAPNNDGGAAAVVVAAAGRDVDVDEVVLGNENPPTVVVVLGAAAAAGVDEKANKLGVVEVVVAAEELAPNANKAGLSDNVVVDGDAVLVVAVANGVLVNEPNVGVADAVVDVVVVVVKDKGVGVFDVVVVGLVAENPPNVGNVEGVLVTG